MEKTEHDLYVAELIGKLLTGDISPEEDLWLKEWVDESAANRAHFEKLTEQTYLEGKLSAWNAIDNQKAWEKLERRLEVKEAEPRFNYLLLLKYAAIVLLFSTVAIVLYRENNKQVKKIAEQPIAQSQIKPGSNHAMLILGNGQKVVLKKHAQLAINEDDGTAVSNQNDVLAYSHDEQADTDQKLIYNTIVVPRGGEYRLILADGSKIWMNSASTLRYPTSFSGNERRVYLTGEAYFEVAKNARMPFIVKTNKSEVQVLGTHFNVMAYDDNNSKTTLLEGAVRVQSATVVNIIKPGQQAIVDNQGQQKITSDINIEEEIAWKNGLFMFKDTGIKEIMQQAARWYDIDVVYEGKIPEIQFSGQMSRKVDFAGFSNILKYAGLHFNIKGKTVTVTK